MFEICAGFISRNVTFHKTVYQNKVCLLAVTMMRWLNANLQSCKHFSATLWLLLSLKDITPSCLKEMSTSNGCAHPLHFMTLSTFCSIPYMCGHLLAPVHATNSTALFASL